MIRIAACLLLLAGGVVAAQPTTNPAGVVEAGDLVEITMFDLNGGLGGEATFQIRIDEVGRVAVPWVAAVTIAGKTTDVAANVIGQAYREGNLMDRPQITMALLEKANRAPVRPGPLGVGDTLRISVLDPAAAVPRWSHINAVLASDGTVTIPVMGPVKVLGLSEGDAAAAIVKAYEEHNLLRHPMVIVLRTMAAGK